MKPQDPLDAVAGIVPELHDLPAAHPDATREELFQIGTELLEGRIRLPVMSREEKRQLLFEIREHLRVKYDGDPLADLYATVVVTHIKQLFEESEAPVLDTGVRSREAARKGRESGENKRGDKRELAPTVQEFLETLERTEMNTTERLSTAAKRFGLSMSTLWNWRRRGLLR